MHENPKAKLVGAQLNELIQMFKKDGEIKPTNLKQQSLTISNAMLAFE
jgi:hypothetical protein